MFTLWQSVLELFKTFFLFYWGLWLRVCLEYLGTVDIWAVLGLIKAIVTFSNGLSVFFIIRWKCEILETRGGMFLFKVEVTDIGVKFTRGRFVVNNLHCFISWIRNISLVMYLKEFPKTFYWGEKTHHFIHSMVQVLDFIKKKSCIP